MLTVKTDTVREGFDVKTCFVIFRGGRTKRGCYVMTTQKLVLTGMDLFGPLHSMKSYDGGVTWTEPALESAFTGRQDGAYRLFCCDFTAELHQKTEKLLGIGQTVRYTETGEIPQPRRRGTCYSVYDDTLGQFGAWKTIAMPDAEYYANSGAGAAQRVELPDGDLLLPFYFMAPHETFYKSAVMRLGFDGDTLRVKRISAPVSADEAHRGAYEPSLIRFGNRYFMTLRTDVGGGVSISGDGLSFSEMKPWQWETGEEIGNYNTQQHFLTLGGKLYLVYTRRGANNNHVFRHRAPLFLAQVDTRRLCLLRQTERAITPERGARLGNFGVTQVSDREAWVTVSEWMQPIGCEQYGSNNAFYIVRIQEVG